MLAPWVVPKRPWPNCFALKLPSVLLIGLYRCMAGWASCMAAEWNFYSACCACIGCLPAPVKFNVIRSLGNCLAILAGNSLTYNKGDDMKRIMKKIAAVFCAIALTGFSWAQAAEYPSHAIKWIVPYLAGTGPDMVARLVAAEMAKILKEPIVIENRGGVGGNIGAQQAAKAPADGYTWVYSGS